MIDYIVKETETKRNRKYKNYNQAIARLKKHPGIMSKQIQGKRIKEYERTDKNLIVRDYIDRTSRIYINYFK